MGLWGGVDPSIVDIPKIAKVMRPALYQWMNGQLQFLRPNTYAASGYSAMNDTGGKGAPTLLWDTGPNGALIQQIRSASRLSLGGQAGDLVGIRFQTQQARPLLPAGIMVKIIDGGNTSNLGNYSFELQEAIDGTLAWGRIMEASVMAQGFGS